MVLLVSHNSWWESGRGRDFVWCSWWWGEESTKPSFSNDSKNLVAQQRWHVLTSNTLSPAFISRASVPVMCVSCFLRPPCFPQALSRHRRSEALSTAVCLCTRACLWMCLRGVGGISNLANRCIIFGTVAPSLRRASLKSLGSLHPVHPPSLRLWESSQAWLSWAHWLQPQQQHKTCWTCGLYTAQYPQHHTTLPTDGCTTHLKSSSLVFSKCLRGFHLPLKGSG